MHRFSRQGRIDEVDGVLWHVVTAECRGYRMDVCKVSEFGESYVRNIKHFGVGGWLFGRPGEKEPTHYSMGYPCGGNFKWELEPWQKQRKWVGVDLSWEKPSADDVATVCAKYPYFKWVMAKVPGITTPTIFRVLANWRHNALVTENLLEAGYTWLAMDSRLSGLKEPKRVLEFLKVHPECDNLTTILGCLKHGCDIEDFNEWCSFNHLPYARRLTFREYIFCRDDINTYIDYLAMAKRAGHDTSEDYWHWPKNIKKAHDKVMREVKAIEKAEEAIRQAEKIKKAAKAEKRYVKAVADFLDKKWHNSKGIRVFVPADTRAFKKQAEALNQCLITCDYMQKVIDRKEILVFVEIKGRPLATAELLRRKDGFKLGQFNGKQGDGDDKARDAECEALRAWARKYGIKIKEAA